MPDRPSLTHRGNFTSYPFAELMVEILQTGLSGSLRASFENRKAIIYFRGGRVVYADSLANLSNAFARIASELREYYSLGYYPKADERQGRVRKIKVRTERPGISLKYRDSYSVGNSRKKS